MIDFLEALRIAKEHIGPECGLMESATIEKPYGWYFCAQSKEYLETGDRNKFLFGSTGFIVDRENGRVLNHQSGNSVENWLKNYEKGFKYESYDLTISKVYDLSRTVQLLAKLNMHYVIPKWAHGVQWQIPRSYTEKELRDALSELPHIFKEKAFWHCVKVFEELDLAKCCEYSLTGNIT